MNLQKLSLISTLGLFALSACGGSSSSTVTTTGTTASVAETPLAKIADNWLNNDDNGFHNGCIYGEFPRQDKTGNDTQDFIDLGLVSNAVPYDVTNLGKSSLAHSENTSYYWCGYKISNVKEISQSKTMTSIRPYVGYKTVFSADITRAPWITDNNLGSYKKILLENTAGDVIDPNNLPKSSIEFALLLNKMGNDGTPVAIVEPVH